MMNLLSETRAVAKRVSYFANPAELGEFSTAAERDRAIIQRAADDYCAAVDANDEDGKNNESNNQSNIAEKSEWVKLNGDAKITDNRSLAGMLGAEKYSGIWVAPTTDHSTFQIMGEKSDGKYEILDQLVRTEGHNPAQSITTLNPEKENNVDTQQANMMLKIKGKENEGLSIARGGMGNIEVSYFRKIPGYDAYISTEVPVEGRDSANEKITHETKCYMSSECISRKKT